MRGKSTLPVKVRILEVEWLSEDLPELYVHMAKQTDIDLFGNDFIKILLEQNAYNWQIFFKVFIFYFAYAIACILYFSRDFIWVDPTHFQLDDYQDNSAMQRALIIVLGVLLILVECFQMRRLGFAYWKDSWNYTMMFSYLLNMFLVTNHIY